MGYTTYVITNNKDTVFHETKLIIKCNFSTSPLSINVHTSKNQCPHQNVREQVFEDECRQHLGLLQEVLRLRPRLCEHVVEAEDAGDEEVEEEAVEAGEAEDAGADPGEDGERGAREVERLVVLHDVPHVQRLRVRRGRGGADHRYEVVRSVQLCYGVVLPLSRLCPFFQIILRI